MAKNIRRKTATKATKTAAKQSKARVQKPQGEYDDANRFVLFPNDKQGNENRPDYTGKLTLNPGDYEVDGEGHIVVRMAAWLKNNAKVGDFLSGQVSAFQQSSD